MEKMQRLNKSFLDWMNRQKLQHGLSIWKDGLQDYINYAGSVNKAGGDAAAAAAPAAAPAVAVKSSSASAFSLSAAPASVSAIGSKEPSFSFSAKPAAPVAAVPAPAAAPASAFGGLGGFSFAKPPDAAPAAEASSGGMFSFSSGFKPSSTFPTFAPSASSAAAPAPAVAAAAEEEEGEEIMAPEVVHRNENDDDEILHEVDCKLFRFNKAHKEWMDAGKGKFRVSKGKDTGKKRILLRNMTGRIMINAFFYKDMSFTKLGKNGIRFLLVIDDSGEPKMLMIKVKQENLESTLSFLQSCVPT
jgi:hypothetical protein